MTDIATDGPRPHAHPSAPARRGPRAWFAEQDSRELLVWGVLIVARADRARDRARRPPVPPRREPGRVLLLPVPPDAATTSTTRCCTARCAST